MTCTEFTFIAFTAWFFFSKFSLSHDIMVKDAAWVLDMVAKRAEEIIFHAVRVSIRMNYWYSRSWNSLDAYLYCKFTCSTFIDLCHCK